jgi:hypothetical protein
VIAGKRGGLRSVTSRRHNRLPGTRNELASTQPP